jgi:hypothetical protein
LLEFSDEQLMAYADGALSLTERDAVAAAVAASPELEARLRPFLATGTALAGVFDDVLAMPVPPELVRLVNAGIQPGESQARRAAQHAGNSYGVVGMLRQLFSAGGGVPFGAALASWVAIAMLAGAAGWWGQNSFGGNAGSDALTASLVRRDGGLLLAQGALASLLETRKSGETVPGPAMSKLAATRTFRNSSGLVCREYLVLPQEPIAGVACRQDEGAWRIELHTQVALARKSISTTPSAGVGTEFYEAAMNAMRGSIDMAPGEEADVMKNWATKAP